MGGKCRNKNFLQLKSKRANKVTFIQKDRLGSISFEDSGFCTGTIFNISIYTHQKT